MQFTLSSDQETLATAIEGLAEPFAAMPVDFRGFALVSDELDTELADAGFFEIATIPELGDVTAAWAVERLARLPRTSEIALSMLVRPLLGRDLPRPFGVVGPQRIGRFVSGAGTVLIVEGESVSIVHPAPGKTKPVTSLFAYPMGTLDPACIGEPLAPGLARAVLSALRVALAAEAAGLMKGALDSAVEHVSVRKQFGRPIGTFQALRHRLAECAVLTGGVRRLALKAAWSGKADDAALAALHAQESATRLTYDLHQMLGAMGVTLEHPLHLWTYRLKALLSDLGGRGAQARAFAETGFPG